LIDLPEETIGKTLHILESIDLGRGSTCGITLAGNGPTTRRPMTGAIPHRPNPRSPPAHAKLRGRPPPWPMARAHGSSARGAEAETFSQYLTKTDSSPRAYSTTTLQEVVRKSLGNAPILRATGVDGSQAYRASRRAGRGTYALRIGGGAAAGARYRPEKELGLRISAGRGFRAPSFEGARVVFDHSFYGYRVLGNPDLVPETSWA